jgi:hypothetical protein
MTPEQVMQNLSDDILGKLPGNFDIEIAQFKYPITYLESMNTVLCQVTQYSFKAVKVAVELQQRCRLLNQHLTSLRKLNI